MRGRSTHMRDCRTPQNTTLRPPAEHRVKQAVSRGEEGCIALLRTFAASIARGTLTSARQVALAPIDDSVAATDAARQTHPYVLPFWDQGQAESWRFTKQAPSQKVKSLSHDVLLLIGIYGHSIARLAVSSLSSSARSQGR